MINNSQKTSYQGIIFINNHNINISHSSFINNNANGSKLCYKYLGSVEVFFIHSYIDSISNSISGDCSFINTITYQFTIINIFINTQNCHSEFINNFISNIKQHLYSIYKCRYYHMICVLLRFSIFLSSN
jgi:hypothetical protein